MLFPRLVSGRRWPTFDWRFLVLVLVVLGIVFVEGRIWEWYQATLMTEAAGTPPSAGGDERPQRP
jgi:hypothetical protein